MKNTIMQTAGILGVAALCGVLAAVLMGCQASLREINSPQFVMQRGPEVNNVQGQSGVNSRSNGTNQQVADTAATQDQTDNAFTSDMPTAMESTRQVGLKQGQAATTTKTQGDTSPATTTAEQVPTGQQGGDAVPIGTSPTANTDNAAAPKGTANNQPGGAEAVTNAPAAPAAPAEPAEPVVPAVTE